MTVNEDLEKQLKQYRDCFYELETNATWFHFNEEHWSFETISAVKSLSEDENTALLHLLCADVAQSRSISIKVQITRQNRYAPEFTQKSYIFYVPLNTQPGKTVGRVEVVDKDPVIYNAQTRITVLPDENRDLLYVDHNGTVTLKKKIFYFPPFKPVNFKLSVIDFGSPQKHSEAEIIFIPVTITQVRKVTVNVATLNYQIFEWESPEFGMAERYHLKIQKNDYIEYDKLVDGQSNIAYFRKTLEPDVEYTLQIEAIDADGKTPSNMVSFRVASTELDCNGSCSVGGRPVCYYTSYRDLRQYSDEDGEHCICYSGYTGVSCEVVEHCNEEETIEVFGRIRWSRTAVNRTEIIPCPFGLNGDLLRRRCHWNPNAAVATWQSLAGDDTCRKQNSVLNSLNKVSSYVRNSSTSNVGAVNAIYHVVDPLLNEAAFMPNVTNVYFDGVVAEQIANVIADATFRNWKDGKDNYTDIQHKLITLTKRLSYALPVPYAISSSQQKLTMKTLEWIRNTGSFRTSVGNNCAVHFAASNYSNIVRVICMQNASLYPELAEQSPVLIIEVEKPDRKHQPLQIELGYQATNVNLTCVRYDEESGKWTNDNVDLILYDQNNFVVCKTSMTGRFSLLPHSAFEKKNFILEQLSFAVPTFSSILSSFGCILLFIFALFQRKRIDFAVPYLFLLSFLFHLVQTVFLLSPKFLSIFDNFDPNLEVTFYFLSVSIIFVLSYISFALNSYMNSLKAETTMSVTPYIRYAIITICVFAFPSLCTISFYSFKTDKNGASSFDSMDASYSFHYYIPIGVTFVVILVNCLIMFKRISRIKKRYRYSEENTKHRDDLSYSAICLVFVYLTALCDIILFFYQTSFVLALLQRAILVLFTVLCYILFASILALYTNRLETDSPTRSLERKRDISRGDLLDRDKHELLHFPLSDHSLDSTSGLPNSMPHSQLCGTPKPMVSIV